MSKKRQKSWPDFYDKTTLNEGLDGPGDGWTEAGVRTEARGKGDGAIRDWLMDLCAKVGRRCGGECEPECGTEGVDSVVGVEGAVGRLVEEGFAVKERDHAQDHCVRHGAMVRAIAATTGR